MTSPMTAKDRIKGAQRQRKFARINLRGDLVAEIESLEQQLETLRDSDRVAGSPLRMTDIPEQTILAERIEGLREQMGEEWLDLTLEQQSWHDWRAFKTANPPREGDDYDQLVGVQFDALVEEFMPKCVVDPKLDAEDWEGIFQKVSPASIRDLGGVAFSLHEITLDVPKSLVASVVMRRSEGASAQPEPGESASDGTAGGSHLSSTSTTTPTESSPEPPSSPVSPSGTTSDDDEPKG